MVRAALARVPSPPIPQDGVKSGIRVWIPLLMVLKDKLDQTLLSWVQALLQALVGPSRSSITGRTCQCHAQPPKRSVSLQRHEDMPYSRCESSLGFRMPKADSFNSLKL